MPTHKVCRLSEAEVSALIHDDQLPDCRRHGHISMREAQDWLTSDYGPAKRFEKKYGAAHCPQTVVSYRHRAQARWVEGYEGRYLVIEAVRRWKPVHGTLQLVPQGTPLGAKRMPASSNGWPERMPKQPRTIAETLQMLERTL